MCSKMCKNIQKVWLKRFTKGFHLAYVRIQAAAAIMWHVFWWRYPVETFSLTVLSPLACLGNRTRQLGLYAQDALTFSPRRKQLRKLVVSKMKLQKACRVTNNVINSSPPGQNGRRRYFQMHFREWKFCIWIEFHWSLFLMVQLTMI